MCADDSECTFLQVIDSVKSDSLEHDSQIWSKNHCSVPEDIVLFADFSRFCRERWARKHSFYFLFLFYVTLLE